MMKGQKGRKVEEKNEEEESLLMSVGVAENKERVKGKTRKLNKGK